MSSPTDSDFVPDSSDEEKTPSPSPSKTLKVTLKKKEEFPTGHLHQQLHNRF
jgi:hypothetical protein